MATPFSRTRPPPIKMYFKTLQRYKEKSDYPNGACCYVSRHEQTSTLSQYPRNDTTERQLVTTPTRIRNGHPHPPFCSLAVGRLPTRKFFLIFNSTIRLGKFGLSLRLPSCNDRYIWSSHNLDKIQIKALFSHSEPLSPQRWITISPATKKNALRRKFKGR